MASRAADIFARSKIEQKRQLIAFVFSNLALRGKTLELILRPPFDLMVNRCTYASWPTSFSCQHFEPLLRPSGNLLAIEPKKHPDLGFQFRLAEPEFAYFRIALCVVGVRFLLIFNGALFEKG